ncbi:Uma2 family endonuclease [Stenomitos frigidus]|uniref:Uma2 family endonuclease n=1 Tax=Stenomitos frigidus TaxID=1886765 RepID=UPI001C62D163|nr:Uma2 family endonuclease [Stenomitos frigidus]
MIAVTPVVGEQRVILQDINWQCFEYLLHELGENRAARLAYDQGVLEIMSPLMPHEHIKRLLEKFIDALAEALDLPIRSAGSLTCKRKDLGRGIEPDSAFYIQTEPLVRHLEQIDLAQAPPPDLMLEVDFSSSPLNKEPIYWL